MKHIGVVIGDPHPIFRLGLRLAFRHAIDLDLMGEAADLDGLNRLLDRVSPRVVVVDALIDGNGDPTASLSVVRRKAPGGKAILLFDDTVAPALARTAQWDAIFPKSVAAGDLVAAIHRTASASPSKANRHVDRGWLAGIAPCPLTSRELDVLKLISLGMSNEEIARAFAIADQTVKNHVTSILRKLGVDDRTQAVLVGLRTGWVSVNDDGNLPAE